MTSFASGPFRGKSAGLMEVLVWVVACLTLLAASGCGRNKGLPPGDHEISLRHGNRLRLAVVHVPPAAKTADPLPVVIAFHGGGSEPEEFREYAGLDKIADREGFLVVYPYGSGVLPRKLLTWNAGTDCCGYALDEELDDVGFAGALLDRVTTMTPVDQRRVYAIGHSNGAMMAYRLAAERSDLIAAITAVAGAMDRDDFSPAQPVAVLDIHSVDDPRAPYDGGLGPPFPLTNRSVQHRAVLEGLARWAAHNGCSGDPRVVEERTGKPGTVNSGQTATLLAYGSCPDGRAVEHWRLKGSGHGWPGRLDMGRRTEQIGPTTTLIDAAAEAWAFMSRYSR